MTAYTDATPENPRLQVDPGVSAPPGLCWAQNIPDALRSSPRSVLSYCTLPVGHSERHTWELSWAEEHPAAATHAAAIDVLVAKGYLPRRDPLTEAEFGPALLAALTAAPNLQTRLVPPRINKEFE